MDLGVTTRLSESEVKPKPKLTQSQMDLAKTYAQEDLFSIKEVDSSNYSIDTVFKVANSSVKISEKEKVDELYFLR